VKKLVITVNTTWNIINFRLGLIKALLKEDFEIYALSPKDEYVKTITEIGVRHYHIDMDLKGTNPIKDIQIIKKYKQLYKKICPSIILSYTIKPNIYSTLAAGSLKIPVINNVSGLGTLFIKTTMYSHIAMLLYKIALRKSTHTFFQNEDDANLFVKKKLIKEKKISVIPGSGVNTEKFKTKRKGNKGKIFLFVGRLIGDKGIHEYLYAAKKIISKNKNIKFWIVGELGYNNKTALRKKELEAYTDNYFQIKYLGKVDDMVSVLEKVDVMVLPSYREGLSKSLVEASAMSLPIITTNVAGCREVVKDRINGLLCDAKNKESLVKSIEDMINFSEKDRMELGENSRKIAARYFSEKLVVKAYLDKIFKILL
tara:strand:+ start:18578 stop:19687 length:1110 start_codon:yes stop_codon:yes gene_type:complete